MNKSIGLFAGVIGLILSFSSAFAGSATWLANPSSGDWNTATNWTPGGPPNDPADMATFDSSTVSNLMIFATTRISSITFNAGGGTPYTISASTLDFLGSGITNNSGMTQNFVVLGQILFANNASAGSNTAFTVPEGRGFFRPEAIFFDSSTAGNATFTINGSTQSDYDSGGTLAFDYTSSAENSTIIVNGSAFRHIDGPLDSPFPAGYVFLFSTAGNATFIANGGIGTGDGGTIRFQGHSTGGTARVKVFGNGNFDMSNHTLPGGTIGSLEGNGIVFLGACILTIGSNNLSPDFSGLLRDGNPLGTGSSSGSITKIGTGTLILSGTNTYTGATTINAGKLEVDGSILSAVTINNGGTLGGSGITRNVTVNSGGTVAPGGSQTLRINGNYVPNAGGVLKIEVVGADPNASGRLNITGNATLDGTLEIRFQNGLLPVSGQVIKVFNVAGALSGSFAQIIFPDLRAGFQFQAEFVNGSYQITALNDGVPATGFLNISTRIRVGTGDNALIGGFIVTGNAPKKVMIRAIGPSLVSLPGRLADPTLELRDSAGGLIFSNDNWVESPQAQQIIDSGIPPSNDHEAAIVATLTPGSYTAIMRGAGNTTGIGVVEVYDLAQEVPAKLANISSRGLVETGDNVMIGGFIAGNQAMHVIVRAIGPSLTQFGIANALADPTLELHNGNGAIIAFNNDWRDNAEAAIEGTGIAPTNNKESAILTTLAPGPYTAIVRGLNDTTGVGLVEVYHLN
jgi:autotransporter-associated beta strand protein